MSKRDSLSFFPPQFVALGLLFSFFCLRAERTRQKQDIRRKKSWKSRAGKECKRGVVSTPPNQLAAGMATRPFPFSRSTRTHAPPPLLPPPPPAPGWTAPKGVYQEPCPCIVSKEGRGRREREREKRERKNAMPLRRRRRERERESGRRSFRFLGVGDCC